MRYTSVIAIISLNIRVQTMDFERQRGFLLESYFLEFMYVDIARDFVGVVFHVLLDSAKGSDNHRDCCCLEPPHSLNLASL